MSSQKSAFLPRQSSSWKFFRITPFRIGYFPWTEPKIQLKSNQGCMKINLYLIFWILIFQRKIHEFISESCRKCVTLHRPAKTIFFLFKTRKVSQFRKILRSFVAFTQQVGIGEICKVGEILTTKEWGPLKTRKQ